MANENGGVYALTTLCPLRPASARDGTSPAARLRDFLNDTATDQDSPMAQVPNTFVCRFFVLDDVIYEGEPANEEHLKSKYLVFTADFHGELDDYLAGLWQNAEDFVRKVWGYGIDFDKQVNDGPTFASYLRKCQVTTTFFFNGTRYDGSQDEPLREQLKALYLKQELSAFAYAHQGLGAAQLQQAFTKFLAAVDPKNADGPTWRPGASSLAGVEVDYRP